MLFSSYFYSTSTSSTSSSRSTTSSTSSSNPPPAPTNTPTDAFDIAPRKDSFTSHSSRNSAATAFPSWPTRPDLYTTATSTSAVEDAAPTAYLSDEDLLFEPESRPMTPTELSTEQVIERQRVFAEQERQRLQWQLQTRQMGLQFSGATTSEKKEKKRRPSAMKKRSSSSRVTMVRN